MNTAPAKKLEVTVETTVRWVPLHNRQKGGFTTLATILVNGIVVASGNIEGKRLREDVIPIFVKEYKRWNIVNKDYLALAQSVGKIPSLKPEVKKHVAVASKKISTLMDMAATSIKSGDGLRKIGQLFATTRQFMLNNGINTGDLDALWDKVVQIVEAFPIHTEGLVPARSVMFFILAGGEWWPAHAGDLNEKYPFGPCLNYRIDYEDGSSESGPAMLGKWANCTADDNPCIPDEVGYWDNYKEYLKDNPKVAFSEWYYQHQKANQSEATKAIYANMEKPQTIAMLMGLDVPEDQSC